MAAPTNYYVDPTAGNDTTGDGSSATPWKTVQKALNTIARNTTDGDQINIKAGSADVLTAALSLTTYGAPTTAGPLILRGYTATAGDGGKGEISGNSTVGIFTGSANNYVHLIDLKLHDTNNVAAITISNDCLILNCEIYNCGDGLVLSGNSNSAIGNNIHDCSGIGISAVVADNRILFNYLKNGATKRFTSAIQINSFGNLIMNNIISVDGASNGIVNVSLDDPVNYIGNSILSASGTGTGIKCTGDSGESSLIINNIVEGFIGTGGKGFDVAYTSEHYHLYRSNAAYNNNTNYNIIPPSTIADIVDNETLGSSPFAKSGSDTYANRLVYFAPNDIGNIHGGAYVG